MTYNEELIEHETKKAGLVEALKVCHGEKK